MRIDHGIGGRERAPREMMIGDDDVHPLIHLRNRLYGRDAAVHRDEEITPLRCNLLQCRTVDPVSLRKTVRDVVGDRTAERTDILHQKRGRGHTVYIVVSVDNNLLSAANRTHDPFGRLLHIPHQKGIVERLILRMEKCLCRLRRFDPAMPQNLSDDWCSPKCVCECISLRSLLVHNPFFQHSLPPSNRKRACHGTGSLLYPSTAAGFAAGRRSVRLRSSIQSWLAMKMEE